MKHQQDLETCLSILIKLRLMLDFELKINPKKVWPCPGTRKMEPQPPAKSYSQKKLVIFSVEHAKFLCKNDKSFYKSV